MNTRAVKAVKKVGGNVSQVITFDAVQSLVTELVEYRRILVEAQLRQEEIRARREVMLTAIAAGRELLLDVGDRIFKERRETLVKMFVGLEQAIEKGDANSVGHVLNGIVTLAVHSPLPEMRALAKDLITGGFVLDLSGNAPTS